MTRRLPLVLAALLIAGSRVFAQDAAPTLQPGAQAPDSAPARTFSVEFSGGTVAQYLDAIRAAFPGANVVGTQGLDQFTLPSISLKEVTIVGALQPLEQVATANDSDQGIHVWVANGVASVSVQNRFGHSVFEDEAEESGEPQIATRIWNITTLTRGGGLTLSDITGAIETAVSIASDVKPEFRIHEPTGMLVVKGLDTQLDIIDEVIGKLEESAASLDSIREQIIDYRGKIAMRQVEMTNIQRMLTEREKQAAAATDEDERNHRTEELLEYQGRLEEYRVNIAELQSRLADLEARVKKPNQ